MPYCTRVYTATSYRGTTGMSVTSPENLYRSIADAAVGAYTTLTYPATSSSDILLYGFSLDDLSVAATDVSISVNMAVSTSSSVQQQTAIILSSAISTDSGSVLASKTLNVVPQFSTYNVPTTTSLAVSLPYSDLKQYPNLSIRFRGTKSTMYFVYGADITVTYALPVNKVVVNKNGAPETLIDLTEDTVTPAVLVQGHTAHDASGTIITGALVPEETVVESLTVTPTTSQQIFQPSAGVDGYTPVTVNPIPSNYGLITYDGSVITVS